MEVRRIYSINLVDYLANRGYEYEIKRDEEDEGGVHHFIFKEDLSVQIQEFYDDEDLQRHIRGYRDIRKRLNALRNAERKLHR